MNQYYHSTDGSPTAGPITLEELQRLNDSGQLGPTTVVAEVDSNGEWVPASSLLQSSPPPSKPTTPSPSNQIQPFDNTMTSNSSKLNYKVVVLTTGCFSGTLDPGKLQQTLNKEATGGWRFARSIHEQKKILGIFSREAHFLVFERAS